MTGRRSGSICHSCDEWKPLFLVRMNEQELIFITNKITEIKGIIVDTFYIKN